MTKLVESDTYSRLHLSSAAFVALLYFAISAPMSLVLGDEELPPPLPIQPPAVTAPAPNSTTEQPLAVELMTNELRRIGQEKHRGMSDLRNAIERLNVSLQTRQQTPPPSAPVALPQSTTQDEPIAEPPPVVQKPVVKKPLPAMPPITNAMLSDQPQPSDDAPVLVKDETPTVAPVPMTEATSLDRLLLADNLFGANDIESALAAYERLDTKALSSEQRSWIAYQMACCHRRLGNSPTAEAAYRELAGISGESIVAERSRWWLEAIQRQRNLMGSINEINVAITRLREEQSNDTTTP